MDRPDREDKIYWHGAHFEALKLEFHAYGDLLTFISEYELNKEALRMDALIIKKNKNIPIEKNIGRIFKGHNIVEYKSEDDSLSAWDYNKVLGYALIYSAFEKVPVSDITITLSLTVYPRELIKTLENERGYKITSPDNGIYYIEGDAMPVQILESKNLSKEENLFLRNLRSNLSSEDMLRTLQSYRERKPFDEKNAFLDRLVKANFITYREVFDMVTGGLKEGFLEAAEKNGWLEEIKAGVEARGEARGKAEGKAEGKVEGLFSTAINMVKELQISVTQAMQVAKLPEQERGKIIEELEKADISYAL